MKLFRLYRQSLNIKVQCKYPKLEKIVINMGVGEVKDNPKAMDSAVSDMAIDYWTKADYYKSKEISCCIQTQRRNEYWL